jgi:hypothetical protein
MMKLVELMVLAEETKVLGENLPRLSDGGKIVSPTRRPLFTPGKLLGTHFC